MAGGEQGRVIVARGPRGAEKWLLEEVARHHDEAVRNNDLLTRPVLVLVPSGTLRQHLAVAIPRRLGGAGIGIAVRTLSVAARDILGRAGIEAPAGDALFEVLARRTAAAEPGLARALGAFDDGFGVAAASIRDLFSAGLSSADTAPMLAALQNAESGPGAAYATAVVKAAVATREALLAAGTARGSERSALAAIAVETNGASMIPARAILIHGFADATGLAVRLLRALVHHAGATLIAGAPPDPADSGEAGTWRSFADRFVERIVDGSSIVPRSLDETPQPRASTLAFSASGVDGEVREIMVRIRTLLDQGTPAHTIGIVGRTCDPYSIALRRAARRFGIPFSGGQLPGSHLPAGRRLAAIVQLLRKRGATDLDTWLLAAGPDRFDPRGGASAESPAPADVRLGLRHLGAASLDDVATLDIPGLLDGEPWLPLPMRTGLFARHAAEEPGGDSEHSEDGVEPEADDDGDDAVQETQPHRRRLGIATLLAIQDQARATMAALSEALWPASAAAEDHARILRQLAGTLLHLEGHAASDHGRAFDEAISAASAFPKTAPPIARDEFLRGLDAAVASAVEEPLGGAGGGVRWLDIARSRGLTFDQLFLLGVNRDVFPRQAHEDPLLSDRCRTALFRSLPDLALKGSALAEERHLFAEAVASSRHVTVSFLRADEDGREQFRSPFVDALLGAAPGLEIESVPRRLVDLASFASASREPLLLPDEAAIVAAIRRDRASHARLLPLALADRRFGIDHCEPAGTEWGEAACDALAGARSRILEAFEPARRVTPLAILGPYAGAIGPAQLAADPRREKLFVTSLEATARCPWQMFLGRFLKLERPPDPGKDLPSLDARVLGMTVHESMEHLVRAAFAKAGRSPLHRLDEHHAPEPLRMARPASQEVDEALDHAVQSVAKKEGVTLAGMRLALATRARPMVEEALRLDWPDTTSIIDVLGVEVEDRALVGRTSREPISIHFRADRADRIAATGEIRLTDYKTGRPLSTAKTKATQEKHIAKEVSGGQHLQGAAYASATSAAAVGRYLFVDPEKNGTDEKPGQFASFELMRGTPAVDVLFPETVRALQGAIEGGAFFPRLLDVKGKSPRSCANCDFAAACLQGDSVLRHALFSLARRVKQESAVASKHPADPSAQPEFQDHLARLWFLELEAEGAIPPAATPKAPKAPKRGGP